MNLIGIAPFLFSVHFLKICNCMVKYMRILTPQNTCFLKVCQIKAFQALSFLLKLNLKLIHEVCLLSLEQSWVSGLKLEFWSRKTFFILVGIPSILVLCNASCISSTSIAEMWPRWAWHISVGFQGLRKYFPSHWRLFPCSHGDGY